MVAPAGCRICTGAEFDREFGRVLVWSNDLWRLSTSTRAPILGFSYLEPLRHVPYVTDLDGDEAATLGPTLARVTSLLKRLTDADLVYVMVFGEHVAHLHFNMAPHREGDALVQPGPQLFDPERPGPDEAAHEAFVARLTAAARDALDV